MASYQPNRIHQQIELLWETTEVSPGLMDLMRRAVVGHQKDGGGYSLPHWALLPGLCCQAAGGDPHSADDLAAAWVLYYSAAHLMDSVEDRDPPDEWWADLGPGIALNTASGLFFSASLALNQLYQKPDILDAAEDISHHFHQCFLRMCSGQHHDLLDPEPDLEQCWEIASAKSGEFFALACRAGARLATENASQLSGYQSYGYHLGLLIQILDDLEDLTKLKQSSPLERPLDITRSIAVAYAMEVFPARDRNHLKECIRQAADSVESAAEVLHWLDQSGAALYLITEIEHHKGLALAALENAESLPEARGKLEAFLRKLG